MSIVDFIILFIVSVIGGSFGTLLGGGSLVIIPTLIFLGLSPAAAIATNRVGITGLPLTGLYSFHNQKIINYKLAWIIAIPSVIGSVIGAYLILGFSEKAIKTLVAVLTLSILALLLWKPHVGTVKRNIPLTPWRITIGVILCFGIGIYGGLYGAGAGTFYSYVLIMLFGNTMIQSAANRKIAGLLFTVAAAIVFIIAGEVYWMPALAIFLGSGLGSYIASQHAERIGNVWLKNFFILLVIIMSVSLLIDTF